MSKVSVAEAASLLGVNVQRVHQRITDGSLRAERIGHQWVIDDADLIRLGHRPTGRPLSSRSAWAMAYVAARDLPDDGAPQARDLETADDIAAPVPPRISSPEVSRARARLGGFLRQVLSPYEDPKDQSDSDTVAVSLRSLLRNRAQRRTFRAAPSDLGDLRSDDRLHLSGISLATSGLSSGDIVEGYIDSQELEGIVRDFLLSDALPVDANVVLHVVDPAVALGWRLLVDSWLPLAADLAEYHRPRETERAASIVRDVARRHPAFATKGSR